ncbi:MAG: AAA family ATPase [Proteobacteria bacterium]|nr:AAA family ATPase [Pseudomonadota bacterium]
MDIINRIVDSIGKQIAGHWNYAKENQERDSTMPDLKDMHVKDLRKLMRAKFPQTRGAFSSCATKEQCMDVLRGAETPEQVMAAWAVNMATPTMSVHPEPTVAATGPVELTEGIHGEGTPTTPADVKELGTSLDVVEAERMLRAIGHDNLADTIVEQAKRARDATEALEMVGDVNPSCVIDERHGKVTIAGLDCPIMGFPTEQAHAIPEADAHYRFDYWQSNRTCGALTFNQTADDLIKLILANMRVMMVGPPGSGKTSVIEQYASRVGWPVTRFNGNRDVTMHDFVGTYEAHDGATEWVDGPLPRAMKAGHILILDEVDHMPAECSSVLHSVLEPRGRLALASQDQTIGQHEHFRIVATANTGGFGDESGLHPNAQVQDAAFLSRFDVAFRVDYMDKTDEIALLRRLSGIKKTEAGIIVKIANDTRNAAKEHKVMYPITTRQTIACANLLLKTDWGTALSLTILNKLPECDVGVVAEIAQRHLGDKLGGKIA